MKTNFYQKMSYLAVLSAVFISADLLAQSQSNIPAPPMKPPKEAVDACSSKTAGASCSFTGLNNDIISGTCRQGPNGQGILACAPSAMPPGGAPGGSNNPPGQPNMNPNDVMK